MIYNINKGVDNMSYKLECVFDSRKSFYGKAIVEENDNKKTLYSYGIEVAEIKDGEFNMLWGGYSQTTYRHVNEFIQQNGFPKMSKKEILNHLK